MVLKKYVPGITHHQLCTVANWNPQLSRDPQSGLAFCKVAPASSLCIETDTRACWCLVRGRLLGLAEERGRGGGGFSVAAIQKGEGGGQPADRRSSLEQQTPASPSETPFVLCFVVSFSRPSLPYTHISTYYLEVLQNTVKRKSRFSSKNK